MSAPTSHPSHGPHVPDHDLVRCIGQGSYGEVWLARNVFGVYRAVKVVRRSRFDSERPFEREFSGIKRFEPVSRSHPSFMAILHVGQNVAEGYFYYVMELADDQTSGQQVIPESYSAKTISSEVAGRGRLPLAESIQVGIAIGDALFTLHSAGLVHRDIKPANIIYVNGRPKLADIGLVHTIESAATFVGTQGYIPPEGPGTVQADIYALGKLLYEISTGNDRQQFPELPDFVANSEEGAAFRELNEVLVRACESNPKDRYASAVEVCNDLQLIGRGESLQRLRQLERRWKFATRTAAAIAIVTLLVGGLGYILLAQHQRTAKARASQVATALASGTRLVDETDNLGALPYFVEAQSADDAEAAATGHRLRIASMIEYSPRLVHCWWHTERIRYADFSPDGRLIAFGDEGGGIGILDWQSGKVVRRMQHGTNGWIMTLEFSRDGRRLVSGARNVGWRVWDVATGALMAEVLLDYELRSAVFNHDGTQVLTAGYNGDVMLWNATNGAYVADFRGHSGPVRRAAMSRDGNRMVTTSHDFTTILWDAHTEAILHRVQEGGWGYTAAFSDDGEWFVTGGSRSVAQIRYVLDGKPVFGPLQHPRHVCGTQFSPDRRMLATVTYGGAVYLWDLTRQGAPAGVLRHPQDVYHAGFSADARHLVTSSFDHSIRVWEVTPASTLPPVVRNLVSDSGNVLFHIANQKVRAMDLVSSNIIVEQGASYPVSGVICNPSGSAFLMTPRSGAGLAFVEGMDARRMLALKAPLEALDSKCFIAEGGSAAASFKDRIITRWDLHTGRKLGIWRVPLAVDGLCVSSNGAFIAAWPATKSGGSYAWLIDGADTNKVRVLDHDRPVGAGRFNGSSRLLVTVCRDTTMAHGYAQVWNAMTGEPAGIRMRHTDGVVTAAFSHDSELVATGGEDNVAFIWNYKTGERKGPLRHQEQVWSVEFAPGTPWLSTGAADGAARVWDMRTGTPLTPVLRQPGVVRLARVTTDRRALVTTIVGGDTRVFSLDVEAESRIPIGPVTKLLSGESITSDDERLKLSQWAEQNRQRATMSQVAWHKEQGSRSMRHPHGAKFHYGRVMALDAATPEDYDAYASAMAELGNTGAALELMTKAARELRQPQVLNRLAMLQLQNGQLLDLAQTSRQLIDLEPNFASDLESCWTVALAAGVDGAAPVERARQAVSRLPVRVDSLPLVALLNADDVTGWADAHECVQFLGAAATAECHAVLALLLARAGRHDQALAALSDAARAQFTASGWQRRARIEALRKMAAMALRAPETTAATAQ